MLRATAALVLGLALAWPAVAGEGAGEGGATPQAGPIRWGDTAMLAEADAAWGRLAIRGDDDWLAVHTRLRKGGHSTLAISRSRDRGRTWTPLSTVAVDGRTLDNGELLALPDGTLLVAMRSLVDGKSYRLDVHRSSDGGVSWRPLSTIDRNESPGGRKDRGLWEPTLALLADGRVSAIYADETDADGDPDYAQLVSQRISGDGGRTWGPKIRVAAQPGGGRLRPGMGVMTRLRDGRYLVVFEICGGEDPECPVMSKVSGDGRAWPEGLGTPVPGQRCGPHVATLADGRVVATSCSNAVAVSGDGGATWKENVPSAWPSGFRHSWPAVYTTGPGEVAVVNGVQGRGIGIRFGRIAPPAE